MLKGKQKAYLRGLLNNEPSIFQVGKEGLSENLLQQLDDALEARELIKITVLNNQRKPRKCWPRRLPAAPGQRWFRSSGIRLACTGVPGSRG